MQKIRKIFFSALIPVLFVVIGCARFEPPVAGTHPSSTFESHKADNPKANEFLKIKSEVIGLSVQGRLIRAFFWGHGKTYVYIIGVIHGNEGNSGQLVEQTRKQLKQNLDQKDSKITFIMIPCLNPDGMYSNRRANANDVDLNRNFPNQDFNDHPKTGYYYRSPSKIFQPEILALLNLCRNYPPAMIYSIHQPLNLINYDGPAETIAQDIQYINGMRIKSDIGYTTPGSLGIYFGKIKKIPVLTLELPHKRKNKDWEYILRINAEAIIFSARKWQAH